MKAQFTILLLIFSCTSQPEQRKEAIAAFRAEHDREKEIISVFRSDGENPVLVQHAKSGIRPYIHPIMAPDGKGELTEYSPRITNIKQVFTGD